MADTITPPKPDQISSAELARRNADNLNEAEKPDLSGGEASKEDSVEKEKLDHQRDIENVVGETRTALEEVGVGDTNNANVDTAAVAGDPETSKLIKELDFLYAEALKPGATPDSVAKGNPSAVVLNNLIARIVEGASGAQDQIKK